MTTPGGGNDQSTDPAGGQDQPSPPGQPAPPQMPRPPQMPSPPGEGSSPPGQRAPELSQPSSGGSTDTDRPVAPIEVPPPGSDAVDDAARGDVSIDPADPTTYPAGEDVSAWPATAEPEDAEQPPVDTVADRSTPDDVPADTPAVAIAPSVVAAAGATAPTGQEEWLDRLCPYLLSEDGTYRSTQPDEGHRCTAQDPPGTLPFAFQEKFCLTDRHVRCEMFKYAQAVRSAALEGGEIAAAQVAAEAGVHPSVATVPVAAVATDGVSGRDPSMRTILIAAAGIGAAVLFILVVILLSGGGGDDGSIPAASGSPEAVPTVAATPRVTSGPTPVTTPDPAATEDPEETDDTGGDGGTQLIEYEVQEGEALLKIAENFDTSRQRIIRANEGMAERTPYTETGDVILVPASAALTIEELESFAGFVRLAEDP